MALSHLVPVLTGNIVIGTERRDTFTESSARAANSLPGGPQPAVSIQVIYIQLEAKAYSLANIKSYNFQR